MKSESAGLAKHEIVLLGVGHTNAHIVRMWAMNPIKDARLTCIANHPIATYSGMLPAVLAGQHHPDEMGIDLVKFCSVAGARLILGDVTGISVADSSLSMEGRTPVHFDVLSIGIGSVPNDVGIDGLDSASLVRIKPMQTFLARLDRRLSELEELKDEIRVVVVGSGVAGVEVLLCLRRRLESRQGADFQFSMVTRSSQILADALPSTRARVEAEFNRRSVTLVCGQAVQAVEEDHLLFESGERLPADVVIWATGARAPDLLREFDLPKTPDGFLATDRTLSLDWKSSELGPPSEGAIFAVGDTGTMVGENLPKAGVYAVRQGPVLWKNIARAVSNRPLADYRPQRSFLRLINKGDGTAIGQWKAFSFEGSWVWRLKDRIDSKFMEKFRLAPMEEDPENKMQCHGCGCKLGLSDLQKSFESLQHAEQPVLDDAVQIVGTAGRLYGSTDFFTDPLGDAYQFGRVTALHASSDLLANGADVEQAFANVVVEEGDSVGQRRWLQEFTEGANREFRELGASIVGGHTIVGPRAEAGFTVVGSLIGEHALTKAALQPGDRLYLTKPLGIGVLLAAWMRGRCPAAAYESLLTTMFASQRGYSRSAVEVGVLAATDVTGFGLAGHLIEMVEASGVDAELEMDAIPILDCVPELFAEGLESSLAPGNRFVRSKMQIAADVDLIRLDVLFDPQTCGGLLLGVQPSVESAWLASLRENGLPSATCVGSVTEFTPGGKRLAVV